MMTPQEIQEKTFAKALLGGYDMQAVDEFVEPLAQDYIELYRENAVLKSKMKVLVKKLEEYRDREAAISAAEAEAQKKYDEMVAEAQKKCDELTSDAEREARTAGVDALVAEETERLNCAKQTALSFIEAVEKDIRGHLELLESLKTRDLAAEQKEEEKKEEPAQPKEKPYDFDAGVPQDATRDIAAEIDELLTKQLSGEDPAAQHAAHPDSPTIKFEDLQFGRNYNPTAH